MIVSPSARLGFETEAHLPFALGIEEIVVSTLDS